MRANMRLAARSAATHCPRFNAYKQQKLDEGKAEMELRIFLAKCSRGFNYFFSNRRVWVAFARSKVTTRTGTIYLYMRLNTQKSGILISNA